MQVHINLVYVIPSFLRASGDSIPVKLNSSNIVAIGISKNIIIDTQFVIMTYNLQLYIANADGSPSSIKVLNN